MCTYGNSWKYKKNSTICVSQRIPRPNKGNCDKEVELNKSPIIFSFYGTKEDNQIFTDNFIYITIHSERQLEFTFTYCYGKCKKLL